MCLEKDKKKQINPVKSYLKDNILLFDGAMGTYFSSIYKEPNYPCELANITMPETIKEIHRQYLEAGAKAIKTNTFSLDFKSIAEINDVIRSGYRLANEVAREYGAFVFCDIGPLQIEQERSSLELYLRIIDTFIEEGATNFLFETFLEIGELNTLATYIKQRVMESMGVEGYVIASFAVNPEGFTKIGQSGMNLLKSCKDDIDVAGFNCVCGPYHMQKYISGKSFDKPLISMPNAGYPSVIGSRVRYDENPIYFSTQLIKAVEEGAKIIGGCCGTTPEFIREIHILLDKENKEKRLSKNKNMVVSQQLHNQIVSQTTLENTDVGEDNTVSNINIVPIQVGESFFQKLVSGQKPIAVELDSPVDTKINTYLEGAKIFQKAKVDMITIADCPVARARVDSSLLACKLKREYKIDVMPHMTCRDRNINAAKALLLGLSIEEIENILIITGDPIPSEQRDEVKSVYEFNSRKMIGHIQGLNETLFDKPFTLYAALNINTRNFDVQLKLAKEKVEQGASAFFTQPVHTKEGLENLKRAKVELGVPIVGGIMPIVSYKNACFMNSEIPGITVDNEIINLYKDKTKEECTNLAIKISCAIANQIREYVDGFYLITPFMRVDIMEEIVKRLKNV